MNDMGVCFMSDQVKSKFKLIFAMLIFGSVGLFVRSIHMESGGIAFLRGIIGSIFLIFMCYLKKQRISFDAIKKNLFLILLSGGAVGLNWILLFEAYNYTTISKATLSYYCAPIFAVLISPLILKEKITPKKLSGVFAAMIGLILVVGFGNGEAPLVGAQLKGIIYGLTAAFFYALVMLINKLLKGLSGIEITLTQLIMSVIVLTPYIFIKEGFVISTIDQSSIYNILILGIVHTGIAYYMYFTAMQYVSTHTTALYSYIDPISAIIMSFVFLREKLSLIQVLGGVIILSSVIFTKEK
jgi:drug/metabolite transporter (DMT)-like permease